MQLKILKQKIYTVQEYLLIYLNVKVLKKIIVVHKEGKNAIRQEMEKGDFKFTGNFYLS